MKFRKNTEKIILNLENKNIIFFIGPRQVGKTTLLKHVFQGINTKNKLFLNLEILDYHSYFQDFASIQNLLEKNGFNNTENFYLFLDEFHKVKNISWILKSLYDEFENLKIIVTGSNNIEINKNITESFAGRKRIINCYPLDFEEFVIWKENIDIKNIQFFLGNPLNKRKINVYLEEFLIYGGYPEIVKNNNTEEKKQIFQDIFSFWFNKDILPEIKKDYKFNDFLKQVAFRNGDLLNLNEIGKTIGVSQPTIQSYVYLLQESLILYPVKPFFSNKLKEIVKMPKYYFIDIGFRNFLMNRFDFIDKEFGILFENFIYSEFLKNGIHHGNIRFWRTKNGSNEVDFILDLEKKAFEVKYKEKIKDSDLKGISAFSKIYPDFKGKIINKSNFLDIHS